MTAESKASTTGVQPVSMNAVWVATVLNLDFPAAVGDSEAQKRELREILDNTRKWELDTVIFQVRPMADAFYRSSINPWSSFPTGRQGIDPGWDPLAYVIKEAHQRGLSLHVWLNPYRVLHRDAGMTFADLDPNSFAARHPEWVFSYDGGLYLDPAVPQVREHIAQTVREIIQHYDVDGIQFDDYFYPYGYPLPEGADRNGILSRERRDIVTAMIRLVYNTIKEYDGSIVFGVSPSAIWKNQTTDPQGSDTSGLESFYEGSNSLRWVREKIVVYIVPQLYWPIGDETADYRKLVSWWSRQLA